MSENVFTDDLLPKVTEIQAPTDDELLQGLPEGTKVEITNIPTTLQQPLVGADGPWIKYVGIATLRILGPSDWKRVGTEGNYHEWNYLNNMRQPKSEFNEKQLHYLLNLDGDFVEVEVDE